MPLLDLLSQNSGTHGVRRPGRNNRGERSIEGAAASDERLLMPRPMRFRANSIALKCLDGVARFREDYPVADHRGSVLSMDSVVVRCREALHSILFRTARGGAMRTKVHLS